MNPTPSPILDASKKVCFFRCPKCGSQAGFEKTTSSSDPGFFWLISGGILLDLLFMGSAMKVRCMRCSHLFSPPPIPRGPLDGFALRILKTSLLFFFVTVLLLAFPGVFEPLARVPWWVVIEGVVARHPGAFLVGAGGMWVMVTLSSLWTFIGADCSHRRDFRASHLCEATAPGENEKHERARQG